MVFELDKLVFTIVFVVIWEKSVVATDFFGFFESYVARTVVWIGTWKCVGEEDTAVGVEDVLVGDEINFGE